MKQFDVLYKGTAFDLILTTLHRLVQIISAHKLASSDKNMDIKLSITWRKSFVSSMDSQDFIKR